MRASSQRVLAVTIAAAIAIVVALVVATSGILTSAPAPSPTLALAPTPPVTVQATPTATPQTVSPSRSPIQMPTFVQMSAPSTNVVWALVGGQALFRSTDRGDNWQERPLPSGSTNANISFVNDREGWVASAGEGAPGCKQQSLRLWHTADGGATYDGGTAPSGFDAGQCKEGLAFVDAQRGFISAWAPSTSPVIYRTNDGGRTWAASRPLPDPPGFSAQASNSVMHVGPVRAFGSTLLVAATGQTTTGGSLYIFRSTDAGATWTYAASAPLPSSLAFVTAARWIEVRSSPQGSRETNDAGATWHLFTTDYQTAAPVPPGVIFADPDVGYATVRGGLDRTVDGGTHWLRLRTPGT